MKDDQMPVISDEQLPGLVEGARMATSSGLRGFLSEVLGSGPADQVMLEQSPPNDTVDK